MSVYPAELTRRNRRLAAIGSVVVLVAAMVVGTGASRAEAATGCHPFPDVEASNSACSNIAWLKTKDITKPADGLYHPLGKVTRGQMTAFLFRLTHPGQRSPRCASRPFPDVATSNVFCGYIGWAAASGVAYGYPNGTYGPEKPVTRGAMAAFLHRIATGAGAKSCVSRPFADVATDDVFCGVITWMADYGITYGVGNSGNYGTNRPVTRQAMASFLHRVSNYMEKHRGSGNPPGTRPQPPSAPSGRKDLRVISHGFTQEAPDDFGDSYLTYGVLIQNPNSASVTHPYIASDVRVNITFTDSKGAVVGSESDTIDTILPDTSMAAGDDIVSVKNAMHMTVKISVSRWEKNSRPITGSFTTSGVTIKADEYSADIIGTARSTFDKEYKDLAAVGLLYDSRDRVIGGAHTYLDFIPANGTASFSIATFSRAPRDAVYAKTYVAPSFLSTLDAS